MQSLSSSGARRPAYAACALFVLVQTLARGAPTFMLQPIASTGPYYISGTEIVIPAGGVEVTFEVLAYGWASVGYPALGAYQATIDNASLLGANAAPPNPGVNLTWPGGYPIGVGCFQTRTTCSGNDRDCTPPHPPCEWGEGFCILNPRLLLGPCSAFCATCPAITECAPGSASQAMGCGASDPGPEGAQAFGYCGTAVLAVPSAAVGTYTIRFVDGPNHSFMNDPNGFLIPGLVTVPARVTIPDCNGNQIADGVDVASGTSTDCDGNRVPDECQPDDDGDGVIDVCDACPEDPDKSQSGQCGCGAPDTDTDGDGVADCRDLCPGDNDTIDLDHNGQPDCAAAIPTVSAWGMTILALALLAAAKLRFGRRSGAMCARAAAR